MVNIAFYGSHNGAYVVEKDGEILLVLEIERLLNIKNVGLAQYKTPNAKNIMYIAEYIPKFLMKYLDITEFDTCYYQNTDVLMDGVSTDLKNFIPAKNYVQKLHHSAHAAGCFYQSPFEEALIFSFDGGGNDGVFNVYIAERKAGVRLLEKVLNPVLNYIHNPYNLGFSYMIFAHFLKDIRQESLGDGNLVYPGKLMGLASYGKVHDNWVPYFKQFHKSNPEGHNYKLFMDILQHHLNHERRHLDLPDIIFDENNRFEGQLSYDIAATAQRAFEECFLEVAKPYMDQYCDLPICITGGCGLNIILNTRIAQEYEKNVFVGPNPNDCGIAVGMILEEMRPETPVDLTYSGTSLLDIEVLGHYLNSSTFLQETVAADISVVAKDLFEGKIIGVARGKSEHGPRALGNRSILCNPSIPNMKDILNEKVKHREWYRPFAPVVRLEDVNKYFEWEGESRWMSFCPLVKEEWREKLSAVTHVDNTARVQTVTREQNMWLYDLLTEFEKLSGIGVLLNTSFNINGKPIVSSVNEAYTLFSNTNMDGLIIEDTYITKV
jgi:carbamoyltransferase